MADGDATPARAIAQHNVINANDYEFTFVEAEFKTPR